MIEILKQKTEIKIGTNINNRGDCVKLSNAIIEVTDNTISYNTLRRLYGIVNAGKPSDRTLNILSQFNGYKNYQHFLNSFPYENSLQYHIESFYLLSQPESDTLTNFIIRLKKFTKNFIPILIQTIRELFYQERFDLIHEVFSLDILKVRNYTYDEVLQIGNSIGFIFRTKPTKTEEIEILLGNENFQDMIFTVFVDYTALNSYYGNWTNRLLKMKNRELIMVFCKCILNLKSYLNNKEISFKAIEYNSTFHPILIGRVTAQKMFTYDSNLFTDLKNLSRIANKTQNLNIQYYYEIILTAMCCKRFDVMKFIIDQFSKKRNFNYQYSIHHYAQFYLMCSIYFFKIKDLNHYEAYRKRINIEHLRLGYKNVLVMMLSILDFHASNENKKPLNTFKKITKSLSLKRFDNYYLIHYFE